MTKEGFKYLIKKRFINESGGVYGYYSREDREIFHKYSDINKLICDDIKNNPIDLNNVIIVFSNSAEYSFNTCLLDNRNVVIDHCTFYLRIKKLLHENGVVYKNGDSLEDDKYCQRGFATLIVKDGIAYVNEVVANPFNYSITRTRSEQTKDLIITDDDLKKLNIDDMNIVFSGFVIKKFDL